VTRGDLRALVDSLHGLMIGREPDLTLLIDIDPATGWSRAKARANGEERFEDFGEAMQARMRQGFLDLAVEAPARFRVIDGARPEDAVAADVLAAVQDSLRACP
jgi:dTMP kinase